MNLIKLEIDGKRVIADSRQTILEVARLAGELANDTKRAYYGAVAEDQLARLAEEDLPPGAREAVALHAAAHDGGDGPCRLCAINNEHNRNLKQF